jgi:hypothetical protein
MALPRGGERRARSPEFSRRSNGGWSDREGRKAGEKRAQLGEDGVDEAVDDANDGDDDAARNLRIHYFFFLKMGGRCRGRVADLAASAQAPQAALDGRYDRHTMSRRASCLAASEFAA